MPKIQPLMYLYLRYISEVSSPTLHETFLPFCLLFCVPPLPIPCGRHMCMFPQFLLKLETISSDVTKPVPYQDYVGQYVKAYYIPESELEGWVKEHNQVRLCYCFSAATATKH